MDRNYDRSSKKEPKVRRIFVASKQKEIKISKCFRVIKLYYHFLRILGCLDYGLFQYKSNRQKLLWKLLIFTQFIVYSIGIFYYTYNTYADLYFYAYSLVSTCYIVNVLSLILIEQDKTVFSVFIQLKRLDSMLKVDMSSITDIITIAAISLHITLIACIWCSYCTVYNLCSFSVFFFNVVLALQHTVLVTYSFVYLIINCRLQKFVSILETNSDYAELQVIYKAIVDLAEEQTSEWSPMFASSLIAYLPQVLLLIYISCVANQTVIAFNNVDALFLNCTQVLECFLLILAPALCAGTLAAQASQIQIILQDKLLQEQDENRYWQIERFNHYVQERDCRLQVYQLFPLDVDFVWMVVSFCITYLIVIIQFTN